MAELSRQIYDTIEKCYRQGIPINMSPLTPAVIRRVEICTQVAQRLNENPLMDVGNFLRLNYGRSDTEIWNDRKLINFIVRLRYGDEDRETAKFIGIRMAKKIMQIGEQTGDWKPIDKGLSHYEKIVGLDREEQAEDITKNTANLPVVFVQNVTDKYRDKESISIEAKQKLLEKYGATEDEISRLIDDTKRTLLTPSSSTPPQRAVHGSPPPSPLSTPTPVPEASASGLPLPVNTPEVETSDISPHPTPIITPPSPSEPISDRTSDPQTP